MANILDGYVDVATRIIEFREQYPDGSLTQVSIEFLRDFAGKDWVVYTAAAYRDPEDQRPGIGTAWEPVPGPTKFTRDSEVQNAETAAWGRAMVAALAVDTRAGIATQEEVRNRQADPIVKTEPAPQRDWGPLVAALTAVEDARALWLEAKAAKASQAILGAIQKKADELAEGS